jgi:enoyl-CoA hydratase/carnithine racemase
MRMAPAWTARGSRVPSGPQVIDGAEAVKRGLALSAHPDEEVVEAAMGLAKTIALQSSMAVQTCVQSLR